MISAGRVTIITTLNLSGEYDITRRDELDQLLDRYGDAEPLVLDFSGVERLDTAALRSLVRFQRARREASRSPLVLSNLSSDLRAFFNLADVDRAFELRDEV